MKLVDDEEDNGLSRTIEAGDPSVYKPLSSPGRFNKFDTVSLLSLNNDYDKLLAENYTELKMKCLNDLSILELKKNKIKKEKSKEEVLATEKTKSSVSVIRRPVQHLTHVNVKVPIGRQRSHEMTSRRVENNFKSGN